MAKEKQVTLPELRGKMTDASLQKASEREAEQAFWARLQNFMEILNGDVEKDKLQDHPIVKDCKYLPISHMEMALDELFFGQWNTENFKWQVISNEVVGSIELSVFHPLTKQWIKRTGATAIQIMVDSIPAEQKKKMSRQEINSWAVSVDNKKPGALTNGGFAKLKAECFKNACLSFGRYLGRDVNREHTASDYLGVIKDPDERKSELRSMISDLLRDNQDTEFIQKITNEILAAEEFDKNTIEFYKSIILKIKPDGNGNK
ncbi:MAG: secretory pathway Sec39 family protein [Bacteroidales bacterium]|nr:secretory pathway Sec39 family protein [Bacteroidales bacterium]